MHTPLLALYPLSDSRDWCKSTTMIHSFYGAVRTRHTERRALARAHAGRGRAGAGAQAHAARPFWRPTSLGHRGHKRPAPPPPTPLPAPFLTSRRQGGTRGRGIHAGGIGGRRGVLVPVGAPLAAGLAQGLVGRRRLVPAVAAKASR